MGLHTVDSYTCQPDQLDFQQLESGINTEGTVLYYLDSDGRVIMMIKKKSQWYIFQRAIREKIRSGYRRADGQKQKQQLKTSE